MNSKTIEFYYSDTTDLDAKRCEKCGSIDFEYTNTRIFCIHCGLVSKTFSYSTSGVNGVMTSIG